MEDDAEVLAQEVACLKFQSTSPVWRTTKGWLTAEDVFANFNPRPPCGGRPVGYFIGAFALYISIHVPRVEDDCSYRVRYLLIYLRFQSTSPVWRTTGTLNMCVFCKRISIHVPRVEDDVLVGRGNRRGCRFQSTSPVWRTTTTAARYQPRNRNFNPRPPCGGRLPSDFAHF